jgi:hypothetical protein
VSFVFTPQRRSDLGLAFMVISGRNFSTTSNHSDVLKSSSDDSPLGKKTIQKGIPPNSTRTDGFLYIEAHTADFQVVNCRFVSDSR